MRHDTQDRWQVIGRVGAELKGDGHVPGRTGDDQLMEVAVADDEVAQPARWVRSRGILGQGNCALVTSVRCGLPAGRVRSRHYDWRRLAI
jgi:hypothetical protein